MSSYRFQTPTSTGPRGTLLPAGDYPFVVVGCDPPHVNPKSGNQVCAVELSIQPDGQRVFANPWAGKTAAGKERDDIAVFLVAVNRAPRPGEEPSWHNCVGAKGKCKLKIEDDLNGTPRNKVAYFHVPKQADAPDAQHPKARSTTKPAPVAASANNDIEPDDIPF